MMPDLERPNSLLGGFIVCEDCEEHCEDGPCAPDNPDQVVDLTEEGDHAST